FSAATPVIVYAQSSLSEIIGAHGGGLMYRTADELRAAIERLRTDSALRERLGREGRTAYQTEFAESPFLTNYVAVVRELLAKKRSGQPVHLDVGAQGPQVLAGRALFVSQDA